MSRAFRNRFLEVHIDQVRPDSLINCRFFVRPDKPINCRFN